MQKDLFLAVPLIVIIRFKWQNWKIRANIILTLVFYCSILKLLSFWCCYITSSCKHHVYWYFLFVLMAQVTVKNFILLFIFHLSFYLFFSRTWNWKLKIKNEHTSPCPNYDKEKSKQNKNPNQKSKNFKNGRIKLYT